MCRKRIKSSKIPQYMVWNIKSFRFLQVTSKLNYAQIGMYRICLGAVVGSNGLINFCETASFINLEIVLEEVSDKPKRSLKELLDNCSP